jgi:hypothetical protein
MEEELRLLEERLLDPAVRRDAHAVEEMLTEDFREIGSSGRVFDRDAIVRELQSETRGGLIEMSKFSATAVARQQGNGHAPESDVAIVVYVTTRRDASGEAVSRARRSSIWVKRDGRWKMVFHQGTKIT